MWRKEDVKSQEVPEISTSPVNPATAPLHSSTAREQFPQTLLSANAPACVSRGIRIHGEISGNEDLFLDGELDGKLELSGASLTIGPNGRVRADVIAREVVVRGTLVGKVAGKERVQIWSTGRVEGEVRTERLAIEDGAVLRGKVETGKPAVKPAEASGMEAKPLAKKTEKTDATSLSAVPVGPAAD